MPLVPILAHARDKAHNRPADGFLFLIDIFIIAPHCAAHPAVLTVVFLLLFPCNTFNTCLVLALPRSAFVVAMGIVYNFGLIVNLEHLIVNQFGCECMFTNANKYGNNC